MPTVKFKQNSTTTFTNMATIVLSVGGAAVNNSRTCEPNVIHTP
jgi:hypothetical protein